MFQSEADMRGLQQLLDQYISLYNNQSTNTKKDRSADWLSDLFILQQGYSWVHKGPKGFALLRSLGVCAERKVGFTLTMLAEGRGRQLHRHRHILFIDH